MKVAIMQPYFLPYIGYFQLIHAVDLFIVYDNIKYSKKGWISRNRMLQKDGREATFSLSLKHAQDSCDIGERELAIDFDRTGLLNRISGAYRCAPHYRPIYGLMERIILYDELNLFEFIYHSLVQICEHLGVTTTLKKSSDLAIDHSLKGQHKVLALCETSGATSYVNAIGGLNLYSREDFHARGIDLRFIQSAPYEYRQHGSTFFPWLSILDVMMFNSNETVRHSIANDYSLV